MQKELNPELFGERKTSREPNNENRISYGAPQGNYLNTDRQIHELKVQNQALMDQLNKVIGTLNEVIKSSNLKFEKQNQQLNRLEQSHNGLATEAGQKISQLGQRLNERKSFELKVQEMVDRLVALGIKGIVDFTHSHFIVPQGVEVQNVDVVVAIQELELKMKSNTKE